MRSIDCISVVCSSDLRHAIPENKLDEVIENGWVHPWVLEDVHALAEPVPYQHPSGAVTFVNLEPSVVAQIESNGSPISPSPVDNSVSPDLIEEDGAPPSQIGRAHV